MELQQLYQELIIDHGTSPRHHYCLSDASCTKEGFNPLCGDRITLYLKFEDNIITHLSFQGKGCAISIASASLMSEACQGKTMAEALQLFENFQSIVTQDTPIQEDLGKLLAFQGVRSFPSRVKCATLAWHTLRSLLLPETSEAHETHETHEVSGAFHSSGVITTE